MIRDNEGNLLREAPVNVRISLFVNDVSGNEKVTYSESHRVKTNKEGVASLKIGEGNKLSEYKDIKLTDLDWEVPHKVKVDLDLNNNGQYDVHKKSELLSVPYAIYAYTARETSAENNLNPNKTEIVNTLDSSFRVEVLDDLTSIDASKALSANKGRELAEGLEKRINENKIADDLITDDAKKVLSAAQGKALKEEIDNKLDSSFKVEVLDELTSIDEKKALSANKGRELAEGLEKRIHENKIADDLITDDATKVLSAAQGKALKEEIDNKLDSSFKVEVLDELTSIDKKKALSANKGRELAEGLEKRINENKIADNLITDDAKKVLSAAQGKALKEEIDNKLDSSFKVEVLDELTSIDKKKALSANKGRELAEGLEKRIHENKIADDLRTDNPNKVLSAKMGKKLDEKINKTNTLIKVEDKKNNLITKWSGKGSNGTSAGTGKENILLGISSGNAITTGAQNTAFGFESFRDNTKGSRNTSIGAYSLAYNTTGERNTSIGYASLYKLVDGTKNVGIGSHPLYSITTGNKNIAIGSFTLHKITTGSENTAIGANALYNVTTGSKNIAMGSDAGYYIANGSTALKKSNNSIFIGDNVKAKANNSLNEIVIGNGATGKGNNTVVIGKEGSITSTHLGGILHSAGFNKRSKMMIGFTYNIGDVVLYDGVFYKRTRSAITITSTTPTPPSDPNWEDIGFDTLRKVGNNNLITKWSGKGSNGTSGGTVSASLYSGIENSFLGINSGDAITTGYRNTAFGFKSLENNTIGNDNTSIGAYSLANNTAGSMNTSIGKSSLRNLVRGIKNIGIGVHPLHDMTTGDYNIAIGLGTLHTVITGSRNIGIGFEAGIISKGPRLQTSNNSIFIGNYARAKADNSFNEIVIGNDVIGHGDNTITIGNTNNDGIFLLGTVYANGVKLTSDKRIKSIIGISDKESDLKKLLDIEITDYTMRDTNKMGNQHFKKVIAQQIEGIVPNIVGKNSGVIPSVYESSSSVETINNMTLITTKKSHGFSKGDMVKLVLDDNKESLVKVKEIKNDNTFVVDLGSDSSLNKVFVYGKQVDDLTRIIHSHTKID
ncbi:hypothetical protein JBKA6_0202 [Ichthyobacterium seriolicida]|uniref:Peptidase S74 domain-containing protein n=1 Tax=Ichthyobacterium seriolicida TaxID=242600 RepID=A0A1J1DWG9_9FLAO|nr:hypothetical protein JBKA6_0202 [Ichthyobacterium seriolicida]